MSRYDGKSKIAKAVASGFAALGTGTPVYFMLPADVEPAWLSLLVFPVNFLIGFGITYWSPKNAE